MGGMVWKWGAGGNDAILTYCEAVCVLSKREKVISVQKGRKGGERKRDIQLGE